MSRSPRLPGLLVLATLLGCGGGTTLPDPTGLLPEGDSRALGREIVERINAWRLESGLPAVALSSALSAVADAHVHDLADHPPDLLAGCNVHSWSAHGAWTSCCYTGEAEVFPCMWDKPAEIAGYPGRGYENAATGADSPAEAVEGWRASPLHRAVILNEGGWADLTWRAVGAALHRGYAVLWFGEEVDGEP
jgi:hypothetical protein